MARFPFLHPLSGTRPRRADTLDVIVEPSLRRLAESTRVVITTVVVRASRAAIAAPWAAMASLLAATALLVA